MTERKPPGTSWDDWIERQIQKAQAEGQFDALPGQGRPLDDLAEVTDPHWWTKKLLRRERVSMLPPALALRGKVERELGRIAELRDEAVIRRELAALNAEIARVNATVIEGPPTATARIDVEAFVGRWRSRQQY